MKVNNIEYTLIKELGKGKSAYSYLVEDDNHFKYVIKKIHHEPCDYYNFTDKFKCEIDDYNYLKTFLNIPKLIDVDEKEESLLKEYIEGKTIQELIQENIEVDDYIIEIRKIASICKDRNINIDYYPTNFIPYNGELYYIDYECNHYDEKWDFDNWGIQYWKIHK